MDGPLKYFEGAWQHAGKASFLALLPRGLEPLGCTVHGVAQGFIVLGLHGDRVSGSSAFGVCRVLGPIRCFASIRKPFKRNSHEECADVIKAGKKTSHVSIQAQTICSSANYFDISP